MSALHCGILRRGVRVANLVTLKLNTLIQKIGERAKRKGKKTAEIAPPQLIEPLRVPYGPFRFKARLPKGMAYEVHVCTDLRNWKILSSDNAGAETLEYLDSEAFKFSYRFYRLFAEDVASVNVIGYASVTLPPGLSMIANPFETHETVSELFKGWPDGTRLDKFDTRLFRLGENILEHGKWSKPSERLMPGEGAIFRNPTDDYKSVSFVGEVMQGNLSVPVPAGFSIRSSLLPQVGNLEELKFPIANGDIIHVFDRDRQKYVLHPYENGKWTDGTPILGIAESFWVAKTEPGNWRQSFKNETQGPES
ncbi:MAG: hypothetical protein C5B50_14620 [Verrucomicrobia bacterium]|nr:MAG: hypothetical protein C5B50_14620 [Verrucomicrobiota bacterium]